MAKTYLGTFSGKMIDIMDPQSDDFEIIDIAHALSMLCRYGGHSFQFYSVAEHSYHLSFLTEEFPLTALLHDASEAYLVDVPRPVKCHLENYSKIEKKIMDVIAYKFKLSWPMPELVKYYDDAIISDEMQCLMPYLPKEVLERHSNYLNVDIKCWSPEIAKKMFLERFFYLTC